MQKIIEKVIESKNFELSDMLRKIDTLWIQGSITEETRKMLSEKARNNATLDKSFDVLAKLVELEKRIEALEKVEVEEQTEETYEEFVSGKWYYNGKKISFDGKNYVCIAPDGATCVWNPAEYPG